MSKAAFTVNVLRPRRIPMAICFGLLFSAGELLGEIASRDFTRAFAAFAQTGRRTIDAGLDRRSVACSLFLLVVSDALQLRAFVADEDVFFGEVAEVAMIEFALRHSRLTDRNVQTPLPIFEMFEAFTGVEFTVGAQGQLTIAQFPILCVLVNPIGEFGSVGLRSFANHYSGDNPLALCGKVTGLKTERGLLRSTGRAAPVLGDPIGVRITLRARRNFLLGRGLLGSGLGVRRFICWLLLLLCGLRQIAFVEYTRTRFDRCQIETHLPDFWRPRIGRDLAVASGGASEADPLLTGAGVTSLATVAGAGRAVGWAAASHKRAWAIACSTVLARKACHCSCFKREASRARKRTRAMRKESLIVSSFSKRTNQR